MQLLFSPSVGCFYLEEDLPKYSVAGNLPCDLMEVSETDWLEFGMTTPPEGKQRGIEAGRLAWVEPTKDTVTIISEERAWRDSELSRADIELNKLQDSPTTKKGVILSWRKYRRELRDWPTTEGFPHTHHRPIAPDQEESKHL